MKLLIRIFFLIALVSLSSCKAKKIFYSDGIVAKRIGNKMYLRSGNLKVDETFNVPSNCEIIGNLTTISRMPGFVLPVFSFHETSNTSISGVNFIEPKPKFTENKKELASFNYEYSISVKKSVNVRIDSCHFKNTVGTCIKVLDCRALSVSNCTFKDIGVMTFRGTPYSYDGIYLGGYERIENVLIQNCLFKNIGCEMPPEGRINDGDGIQILTRGVAKDITIINNVFDQCSARGVKIQSGENVLVQHNTFIDGGSAVIMPMLNQIKDITISNNKVFSNTIAFGTDKAGEPIDALNLNIINNEVDSCVHFFRTSGKSSIRNSFINNNRISNVEQFVISGRFFDTEITNNVINRFATSNHKSWKMAILFTPECENVLVENNSFGIVRKGAVLFDNRSKNKIILRNNKKSN